VGFDDQALKLLAGLYLFASLITVLVYAVDKSAAISGRRRIREDTLHFLALLGGWPGAIIAQNLLRHKTRKQPFRGVFIMTIFLNCGALAWMLSPYGIEVLQSAF